MVDHKDEKKATSESKEGFPKAKADEVYTGAKPPEQPPEPPVVEAPPPEPSAKTKAEMEAGKKAVEGK